VTTDDNEQGIKEEKEKGQARIEVKENIHLKNTLHSVSSSSAHFSPRKKSGKK
jgi:hypothetical protein